MRSYDPKLLKLTMPLSMALEHPPTRLSLMSSISSRVCPGLTACVCAYPECGHTLRLAQTSVLLTQQAGACAFPTCLA